jgi:hypothetical protein
LDCELEAAVLKLTKNKTDILSIANILTNYARGEVLQMVWKLIALGIIKTDAKNNLYLPTKKESKMTKTTKTTSNVRSAAARKAHETRRRNAQKRSDAAKKAWATRRAQQEEVVETDRSSAARKAWVTRRAQAEFERRSQAAKKAWATRRNG